MFQDQSNNSLQQKVGSLTFQKSLFQIVTGRKYQYYNQLKKEQQKLEFANKNNLILNEELNENDRKAQDERKMKEFEKKSKEEQDENERLYKHSYGSNLVYGQEIQLVHKYSECTLSLNSKILAKQHCCRELSLEEHPNIHSNFRILSMNQIKNLGEPILYGDQIVIQSSQMPAWHLGIQRPSFRVRQGDGLEVNASEQAQTLKISSYLDNKTEEDLKQQQVKGNYLQSGDVVTIKNRFLGGFLTVKREKKITEGLEPKQVNVKDYDTQIYKSLNQHYFDVIKLRKPESIKGTYKLYVDQDPSAEENLDSLWQIQHVDSLTYYRATYESKFLIRHVCTGLFLEVTTESFNQYVSLTFDGLKQECQFNLKSKKTSNDPISYSEACKIQSVHQPEISVQDVGVVIVCLDDRVSVQRKSQKQNIERSAFLFKLAPVELSKTAFRLNSLQTYLIQFYIFLQDWGIVENEQKKRFYEYYQAFNNQKLLYDEILQLFQSLDNLKMYLTNDGKAQSNELLQAKQQAIQENDIIDLLFAIQRLSCFMIYGNTGDKGIQDKSPQKIAKNKLDPQISSSIKMNCIQEVYTILNLCVQSNPSTSYYVLNLKMNGESILDFLLQQLKYQRLHVSNLIKESVRYTDMSDTKSNITKWVKQLQPLTEENIEDQSLYIEILSLMMIDPYENPNYLCQNICRRLLFRKKENSNEPTPFELALVSLDIKEEEANCPIVLFSPKREKGQLQNISYQFGQNNPTFCQLYSRFIEKQIRQKGRFLRYRPTLADVVIEFFTTATLKENQLVKQEDVKTILPIFQKYENYLMNVMDLYSALCKGRNQKSISCLLKNCFLHGSFLETCLRRQQNINTELRFEKTLLDLFCNLYLDIDPLIKVSTFDNKCFLNDDLEQFFIENQSGQYFYENNASKSLRKNQEFKDFLNSKEVQEEHQLLKVYAAKMLKRPSINEVRIHYIEIFTQEQYPDHFKISEFDVSIMSSLNKKPQMTVDYQRLAQYQLQYFLGILALVKNSINLGYNQLDENRKIFSILPNIFVALILQQVPEGGIYQFQLDKKFDQNLSELMESLHTNLWVITFLPTPEQRLQKQKTGAPNSLVRQDQRLKVEPQFSRNWILPFLIWTYQFCNDDLLKMKVYLEALEILRIIRALKINLQILDFLFSQQKQNESNLSSPSQRDLEQFEFNDDQIPEQEVKKQRSGGQKSISSVFKEPDGNKFSTLLFHCLLSSEKRTKLNEELLQILIGNFHLPKTLASEIKEVEIIDNKDELRYFSIINGNSNQVELISPKEAIMLTKRAIKFIKNKTKKRRVSTNKRTNSFDKLKLYLNKLLDQFELLFKPNSQDAQYLVSFQNIVRNAGVHNVFLQFLISPQDIVNSSDIVAFYKKIIQFFKYFTYNNQINIQLLSNNEYMFAIMDLIQIEQEEAQDQFYIPIKITSLICNLIACKPEEEHDNLIFEFFQRINSVGDQLMTSQQFFVNALNDDEDVNSEEIRVAQREIHKDAICYCSLIQYLKILKVLTKSFNKPAQLKPINKHLILTQILKSNFLKIVMKPLNYYKYLLIPDQQVELNKDQLHFHRIKLHAQLIMLITECCQYYRLGIQEMQRILLYEELKTVLLSPTSEYIVKRAYLQCLFELFINKVKEGDLYNDTVDSDEVRDILSRIIIPELDQKQICKYLEGLARMQLYEDKKKSIQKELRDQIIRQKKSYFEKRQAVETQSQEKDIGIIRDSSEFWSYIRKNGIIHFLVYTYDEMKDRTDLDNEGSNLSDEFAIIKQNVQKIKDIFNVLERDFRVKKEELDLDEYRELITSIEEIIPQRKITKFGQNFRIGFVSEKNQEKLLFDKYDTLKEDQNGEKKLQEQDNVQRIENPFQRNFKIYLIRSKVSIVQFCQFIELNAVPERRNDKIKQTCNVNKVYITQNDIDEIYKVNVEKIKDNNRNKSINEWEAFKQAMRELFERKQLAQGDPGLQIQLYKRQQEDLERKIQSFEEAAIKLLEKQYTKLGGQVDYNTELLSEDIQIELLIRSLKKEQTTIMEPEHLQGFLKKCQDIFVKKEIYLIKLCRLFLQLERPTQDEIDELAETKDESQVQGIKDKKKKYFDFQVSVVDSQLDILAFEVLNNTDNDQYKIEAISFLVNLLDYGNDYVQKKFYELFKSDPIIKQKFITFLRNFFQIDLDLRINELKQPNTNKTEYQQLCLKVLQLLQALCENVNVDFQIFLVRQYDDDSYQANINIVNEVASLLSDLLEKGSDVFDKLQEIYRQALESLVEFSTGYEENKKELCKNARLFTLLNQILQKDDLKSFRQVNKENRRILEDELEQQKYNELSGSQQIKPLLTQAEEERKFTSYQTLQSFIKLLLLLTQGKQDLQSLRFILDTVQISRLLKIAKCIYDERIKPKNRNIVLDNLCDEQKTGIHRFCTNSLCHFGLRSDEDNMLIQTGFSIFIICTKLAEHFPEDQLLTLFQFDEKEEEQDDLIFEDFQTDELTKKQTMQSKDTISKKQIAPLEPESKYEIEESQPLKKFGITVNRKSMFLNQITEDAMMLQQLLFEVEDDESLKFERKMPFFKFYRQFTGRIEIQNEQNELEKVYFQKPFLCNFITPNIKQHLIYEINRETDEDRMLGLIEHSEFYSIQMIHSQQINNRALMHFGAIYWRLLKDISFILCLIIVILLIFMHDTVVNSKLGSKTEAPEDNNITAGESFVSYLNNVNFINFIDYYNYLISVKSNNSLILCCGKISYFNYLQQRRNQCKESLNFKKRSWFFNFMADNEILLNHRIF
ncbi:hypothetical protein FGO68_gene1012 [Halteria grandinella]|uniref:Uncharacterized protein n=1 Tax=Halteria grandinella TaxID=5974 RepID=A0A8J8SYJ5_HALGN|nr:hypothetical protein FGO68_gene1012 [Halteria grandinella]